MHRGRQIIKDIASGLFTLHDQGVAHLDLKSGSILLTSKGRGKIADFGLGKMMNGMTANNTFSALGSLPYMAPELLLHGDYSRKCDIWSFSTIIIEVCPSELL